MTLTCCTSGVYCYQAVFTFPFQRLLIGLAAGHERLRVLRLSVRINDEGLFNWLR